MELPTSKGVILIDIKALWTFAEYIIPTQINCVKSILTMVLRYSMGENLKEKEEKEEKITEFIFNASRIKNFV